MLIAFSRQNWLRERTLMLRCTCIACLVYCVLHFTIWCCALITRIYIKGRYAVETQRDCREMVAHIFVRIGQCLGSAI
jgi:hypothetical protein